MQTSNRKRGGGVDIPLRYIEPDQQESDLPAARPCQGGKPMLVLTVHEVSKEERYKGKDGEWIYHKERCNDPIHDNTESNLYPDIALLHHKM
jgi:hypothetical protein